MLVIKESLGTLTKNLVGPGSAPASPFLRVKSSNLDQEGSLGMYQVGSLLVPFQSDIFKLIIRVAMLGNLQGNLLGRSFQDGPMWGPSNLTKLLG